MDQQLYAAAEVGDWEVITRYQDQLSSQLTPNKDTALHILAQFSDSSSTALQILDRKPKLITKLNAKQQTPLHIAAREGHSNVVRALLDSAKMSNELNSLLRCGDKYGNLAIHEAAKRNHLDIVEIFIKEDPNLVYLKNKEKRSSLYIAIEKGNRRVAETILLYYKKEAEDWVERICYMLLSLNFQSTNFGNVGSGPGGKTLLHAAAMANSPGTLIRLVCEKLPNLIEKVDHLDCTPLHYALRLNHQEAARALLLEGKSMAYMRSFNFRSNFFRMWSRSNDYFPETALHVAVIHGNKQVIEEFLSTFPDCWQVVTFDKHNIFHLAVDYEQQEIFDFMLEKPWASILINDKDDNGNTPLHWYTSTTNLVGSNLLNHPKLDPNPVNSQGLTPLDLLLYAHSGNNLTSERQDLIKAELEGIGAATSLVHTHRRNEVDKETKGTYMIVATLLVTVTFTAIFQPPGGYNSETGKPILADNVIFRLFLGSDMMALILSIASVMFLLWLPKTHTPYLWMSSNNLTILSLSCVVVSVLFGVFLQESISLAAPAAIISCYFVAYFISCRLRRSQRTPSRLFSLKGVK